MSLTFANFKQVIPANILKRGHDYMGPEHILDLSFDEDEHVWEARVRGTELYDVHVEMAANGELTTWCTCPYEHGDYCKHLAAVLYTIEDAYPDELGTKPRKKGVKRLTRQDKLAQLVRTATHEQLGEIVLDLARNDRDILNWLMIRLSPDDASPADYRRVLKDLLHPTMDEDGDSYLDFDAADRAAKQIMNVLGKSDEWRERGDAEKSARINQVVVEEVARTLEYAIDDSEKVAECADRALYNLIECAKLLDEHQRQPLFSWAMKLLQYQEISVRQWIGGLLSLAIELAATPEQYAQIDKQIDDLAAKYAGLRTQGFLIPDGYLMMARSLLIEEQHGPDAAEAYLRKLGIPEEAIRAIRIQRMADKGELSEALQLLDAEIRASQRAKDDELSGALRYLQAELVFEHGTPREQLELMRNMWLKNSFPQQIEPLKALVPPDEWPAFVETLLADTRDKPRHLVSLLEAEKRWDDLMTALMTLPDADQLMSMQSREKLERRFPERMCDLYERLFWDKLIRARTYNHYKSVVAFIRRIRKLGQTERAEGLAAHIRERYADRPQLIAELGRL